MSTKGIIAIIVAIVIVGGGLIIFNQQQNPARNEFTDGINIEGETPGTDVTDGSGTASGSTETVSVMYTAQGFSPAAVTIKKGDTIRFVNESGDSMWVASAQHPTHTVYSGTSLSEHCGSGANNDAFDQCGAGDEYLFTFDKTGEWKYHDHLHASKFGSVTVE